MESFLSRLSLFAGLPPADCANLEQRMPRHDFAPQSVIVREGTPADAALAAVRLRLAALPEGVTWTALHGCAWLGGIGFTMSLFIATLAFQGTNLLDSAKVGILGGSILAAIVGTIALRHGTRGARNQNAVPPRGVRTES